MSPGPSTAATGVARPRTGPANRLQPPAVPHLLHGPDRTWTETNCYVDLWIELLAGLGLEPLACSAYVLGAGLDGDQWEFPKPPAEDLEASYGLVVRELNVWRGILDHVESQLAHGRLVTMETDSWGLPDTRGTAYRERHEKTTIVPYRLDRVHRKAWYLHNAGHFEVSGDDFDLVFDVEGQRLPPYTEVVLLDEIHHEPGQLLGTALEQARRHLARRPATNPVRELAELIEQALPGLVAADDEVFHGYAFATCRQAGASAEVGAAFVHWVGDAGGPPCPDAITALTEIALAAKALQFSLARAARGRNTDWRLPLDRMADAWDASSSALLACYG